MTPFPSKFKLTSIGAFDGEWYVKFNDLEGVIDPLRAWSHYKKYRSSAQFSARFLVSDIIYSLISELYGHELLQSFNSTGLKVFADPSFLWDNSTRFPFNRNYDVFKCFSDELRSVLISDNPYASLRRLNYLLSDLNGDISGGNRIVFQFIKSLVTNNFHTRVSFDNNRILNFLPLSDSDLALIRRCFDRVFYRGMYPDLSKTSLDLFDHYISLGRSEFRTCSEIFDPIYYLNEYKDVHRAKIDPFLHYIAHGWKEKRNPSEMFSHALLARVYPDALKDENGFCGYFSNVISGEQKLEALQLNYNNKQSVDFVRREKKLLLSDASSNVDVFAFYLTQFHPISENDSAWGEGFTEWRNVTKAFPRFFGHYQPKLPIDNTLYDLRIQKTMTDQIKLAMDYGINGFCFYYYWFSGRRVLEEPLNNFLSNKSINSGFKFTILWANENWTRKWDGGSKEVIVGQDYSKTDALRFISDVEDILLDSRYHRVQGAPMLIVYRPDDIPNCKEWVSIWREYWSDKGYGKLHLVCVQFKPMTDPFEFGFDAMLQFPPNGFPNHGTGLAINKYTQSLGGNLFSFDELHWRAISQTYDCPIYRTSVPSWDNDSRRPQSGDIFVGSSPQKFRDWTISNILSSKLDNKKGTIFVNAWNEWAESACLEPDRRYGYAHLQAVADANQIVGLHFESLNWKKSSANAIIIHVFYIDVFQEIAKYLEPYASTFDLYFTIPPHLSSHKASIIYDKFPDSRLFVVPNNGRDVAPFFDLLMHFTYLNIVYDNICKLHTKKSTHRVDGNEWLQQILFSLLPSDKCQVSSLLGDSSIGMLIPKGHALKLNSFMGGNKFLLQKILDTYSPLPYDLNEAYFSSGTMFWIKHSIMNRLLHSEELRQFESERAQIDGTLAHAWERAFATLVMFHGFDCKHPDGTEISLLDDNQYQFTNQEGLISSRKNNNIKCIDIKKDFLCGDLTKVAFLAVFVSSHKDYVNLKNIIDYLNKYNFYIVCIDPSSLDNYDYQCLNFDALIRRSNIGYDFGSWAEAYIYLSDQGLFVNNNIKQLLFINDSAWLIDMESNLMSKALEIEADVVGLTDNNQFFNHLQSNFLLFNNSDLFLLHLFDFFEEYLLSCPDSKFEIINQGELALNKLIQGLKMTCKPIYSYADLVKLTLSFHDKYKDSVWYSDLINSLTNGAALNPHHYLSEALYVACKCPFVKKEVFKTNPANNPFVMDNPRFLDSI